MLRHNLVRLFQTTKKTIETKQKYIKHVRSNDSRHERWKRHTDSNICARISKFISIAKKTQTQNITLMYAKKINILTKTTINYVYVCVCDICLLLSFLFLFWSCLVPYDTRTRSIRIYRMLYVHNTPPIL